MENPDGGAVKSRLAHTKCAVHTPTMFGTAQTHAISKRRLMWIILLFLFLKFVLLVCFRLSQSQTWIVLFSFDGCPSECTV